MNHSASSIQLFDKAIASFLYFKSAEGLRDRSIDSYQRILDQCAEHLGPSMSPGSLVRILAPT
jgi:hypothetical protein